MSHIERVKEVLAVLTVAESTSSLGLKEDLCKAAGKALRLLADELDPRSEIVQELPPEALLDSPQDYEDISSTSSKGVSKYHDFISELSPHARRALPSAPQKERFKLIASLWSKHKASGYQEAVLAAKKELPIHSVPVFGIELDESGK